MKVQYWNVEPPSYKSLIETPINSVYIISKKLKASKEVFMYYTQDKN